LALFGQGDDVLPTDPDPLEDVRIRAGTDDGIRDELRLEFDD